MDNHQDHSTTPQPKPNPTAPLKYYLGNLQEKVRKSGDRFLVGTICLDDIGNIADEFIKEYKNGKRYVKIIVNPFKDGPNQHGNTHSIAIDTFQPQGQRG